MPGRNHGKGQIKPDVKNDAAFWSAAAAADGGGPRIEDALPCPAPPRLAPPGAGLAAKYLGPRPGGRPARRDLARQTAAVPKQESPITTEET